MSDAAHELILGTWLTLVRQSLYKESPEPVYWREHKLLQAALTWPAAEFKRLGWPDPGADTFEALLRKCLRKVALESAVPPAQLRNRAAFLYKVIQDELTHNRDEWWQKTLAAGQQRTVQSVLGEFKKQLGAAQIQDVLAAAHDMVKPRGGRPKKNPSPKAPPAHEIQSELF